MQINLLIRKDGLLFGFSAVRNVKDITEEINCIRVAIMWSLIIQKSITVDEGYKKYSVLPTAVVNQQLSGLAFLVQHAGGHLDVF